MTPSDEIRKRVTHLLVLSLGAGEDDITPSATLLGDLGAESIDFLDITFRLEREFKFKIPRGELFIDPFLQGDVELLEDGRVTQEGLCVLRSQMPYADLTDLERGQRLTAISDLFTVDLLARYVAWKLDGDRASAAGASAAALVAIGPSRS